VGSWCSKYGSLSQVRADSFFCKRTLWVSVIGFSLLLLASSALEAIRLHTLTLSLPLAPGGMFGMLIGDATDSPASVLPVLPAAAGP